MEKAQVNNIDSTNTTLTIDHEYLAEKVAKSGYFSYFNVWNGVISENIYKFASNIWSKI